jgi:D-alanyl-D-alanine endopeptidase (penicillin-binding protein 7)
LVVDLDTDALLYEKDADAVRPIASISKLFGALVLLEECKLDPAALHEMSPSNRDAARGGDKTKLTTGWSYTHRDLLHAALMRSDNRALPALAEACGLEPPQFAARMTARAQKLGLVKTFFKEPDGLSPENVSTAREVLVALRAALKLPQLTEIMEKPEYVITAHKAERSREIRIKNTDRLLSKNLAQILGGKTGYTDIARYCLAVAARTFEGRNIGMVFLGAEGKETRFADFTRVIKWIDALPQAVAGVKSGVSPVPLVLPIEALRLGPDGAIGAVPPAAVVERSPAPAGAAVAAPASAEPPPPAVVPAAAPAATAAPTSLPPSTD